MENVELGKFNEFECQVSPDHQNQHQQLRAKAVLNVIGKCNSNTAIHNSAKTRENYHFYWIILAKIHFNAGPICCKELFVDLHLHHSAVSW